MCVCVCLDYFYYTSADAHTHAIFFFAFRPLLPLIFKKTHTHTITKGLHVRCHPEPRRRFQRHPRRGGESRMRLVWRQDDGGLFYLIRALQRWHFLLAFRGQYRPDFFFFFCLRPRWLSGRRVAIGFYLLVSSNVSSFHPRFIHFSSSPWNSSHHPCGLV